MLRFFSALFFLFALMIVPLLALLWDLPFVVWAAASLRALFAGALLYGVSRVVRAVEALCEEIVPPGPEPKSKSKSKEKLKRTHAEVYADLRKG